MSMRWEGDRLIQAEIFSHKGESCAVMSKQSFRIREGENAIAVDVSNEGVHRFPTLTGSSYVLIFDDEADG